MSKIDDAFAALLLLMLEISDTDIADGRLSVDRIEQVRKAMRLPSMPFWEALERLVKGHLLKGGDQAGYWTLSGEGYEAASRLKKTLANTGDATRIQLLVAGGIGTVLPAVHEEETGEIVGIGDVVSAEIVKPTETDIAATAQGNRQGLRKGMRSPIRVVVVSQEQADNARTYLSQLLAELDGVQGDNDVIPWVRRNLEYMDFVVDRREVEPETLSRVTEFIRARLGTFAGTAGNVALGRLLDKFLDWVSSLV